MKKMKEKISALMAGMVLLPWLAPPASAVEDSDLQEIRQQIQDLKRNYERRIHDLEVRLQKAEKNVALTQKTAPASAPASTPGSTGGNADIAANKNTDESTTAEAVPVAASASAPASTNSFNPDISLILSGTYGYFSQNPNSYQITGFMPGGDIGPGKRSFSLGESELGISADIDPWFYGACNLSFDANNDPSIEEAFIQTTALPTGLKIKAGRFYSGIGYLNEQHSHTWDFVDAPLVYQAFLGSQFHNDGTQVKWLLPTDQFIELGAEAGLGNSFPATDNDDNGVGVYSLFAHTGGDVGNSNSWRAGVSYMHADPQNRAYDTADIANSMVENAFSGTSNLFIGDFVWKWAPNGNGERTNFKLQGEYFYRRESGDLTYDTRGLDNVSNYSSWQSGWYLQGVYQFMPTWRVGLRYDQLYGGAVNYDDNQAYLLPVDYNPDRETIMIDWTRSEFSRIRLQFAQDHSRQNMTDYQIYLQYQVSLGAHGAHIF
ncbi:MAG: porin [Desulfobulbaceae bacterium]|nr:porin [Desulfobulbaceae bacterium]